MYNPDRKDEKLPPPKAEYLVLNEVELKEVPDMELRSRYYRLIEEAKRTQVELERRKLFAKDMFNIRNHVATQQPQIKTEKQRREQQKIQEAVAQLAASIRAGGVTKEQLLNKLKKGA